MFEQTFDGNAGPVSVGLAQHHGQNDASASRSRDARKVQAEVLKWDHHEDRT